MVEETVYVSARHLKVLSVLAACAVTLAGCGATPVMSYVPAQNQRVEFNEGVGTITNETPDAAEYVRDVQVSSGDTHNR